MPILSGEAHAFPHAVTKVDTSAGAASICANQSHCPLSLATGCAVDQPFDLEFRQAVSNKPTATTSMSSIASFYLLPTHKSAELVAAAQAQKQALTKRRWGIFKPKTSLNPDPFWSFLAANAKELAEFPYSGYLLLDVETMIEGALSGDSADDLGSKLSDISGSSFVTYSAESARLSIKLLESANLSNEQIKAFLEEENRGEEFPLLAEPLRAAVGLLKAWLEGVTVETTGILNIG